MADDEQPSKVYPCEIGAPVHMNVPTAETILALLIDFAADIGGKELGAEASYEDRVARGRVARSRLDNMIIFLTTAIPPTGDDTTRVFMAGVVAGWSEMGEDQQAMFWANANDEEREYIVAGTGYTGPTD